MIDKKDPYLRFLDRYEAGPVPWDDPMPPPEVERLAMRLPAGRALDLGCGYGRVSIYLAHRGWSVDGIDFIPQAIQVARSRARDAGVDQLARFHLASAAAMDFLEPPYDLAIDIGCMHSFTEELLRGYHAELTRLLRASGDYVLFAHLSDDNEDVNDDGPRGIPEPVIMTLLSASFVLEHAEYGLTQVEDRPAWKSAWFWFRRK